MMRNWLIGLALIPLALSHVTAQDDEGWPVEQRCVGAPTAPPEGWTYDGTILMTGYAGIHAVQADWETPRVVASAYPLYFRVDSFLGSAGLSPDKYWFAVAGGHTIWSETFNHLNVIDEIVVYSTIDRNEVYRMPWQNSYLERWGMRKMYWLDNERLIYEWSEDELNHPGELYVINPFEGTYTPWTGEVDLSFVGSIWRNSDNVPNAQYPSPDLTRTLYVPQNVASWGVYDVINGELITELDVTAAYFTMWTPDSSHFVTTVESGGDDTEITRALTLFDRNGNYTDTIFAVGEDQETGVQNAAWSPDGRFIAVRVRNFSPRRTNLYVVAMDTQTVTDTCLSIGNGLAWSPDGTQLAFFQPSREQTRVTVLDLETWQLHPVAVHIAESYDYVLGWRTNP